jgi:hypothetical protein
MADQGPRPALIRWGHDTTSSRRLQAHQIWRITSVALAVVVATCVDQPTPTSVVDQEIPDSQPTAVRTSEPQTATAQASAAIAHTLLTSGLNTVNQKVYTTAAVSPLPNALITVAVLGYNSKSAPPSPTLSGGGMSSWTVVATTTYDAVTQPHARVTIYRAMSSAPGSGPLTITFSVTESNCEWIVSQWEGVETSGANGATAIGQTGLNRVDAANGLSVTLGALATAGNVAYGVFGVRKNVPAVAPGTGFTEIAEQPSGESTWTDLQAEWSTNDSTIDASWTKLNGGALGVEIKVGGGDAGVSASRSTVMASSDSITAGTEMTTVTVTANDASGNPVSGATVEVSATGTGNTISQPTQPTDVNGVATGTFSSTVAEEKTISAKVNGTAITQKATVTALPGPVSATRSSIVAAPASIAPGSGSSTITVTAKDSNGNPISGAAVVLATTGNESALTQPAAPTNSSGAATGTLSSTAEGTATVSATIDGAAITQTATVVVTAQTASTITHTLLTVGNVLTNQNVYTTASVAPAPNALVTIAVLSHRSTATISPTVSGGGMASWGLVASVDFDSLSLPHRRLSIYRAMSASPGSGPITFGFTNQVSNLEWIVSQWDGVETSGVNGAGAIGQSASNRADATNGLSVSLAPFDNAANVAYGAFGVTSQVAAVIPGSGFTEIAEQPANEGTKGDLQTEWAANRNAISATWTNLRGGALGVEIRAGNTGPVAPVASVEVSPGSASVAVGSTVQLTAAVRDAGGEPLTGRPVSWETDAPQVATVSAGGLVRGVGAGGPATIRATSEGKTGTASVTVTANSQPVASVQVTPGSASISTGGTVQLAAIVKDAADQPLTGRAVTWESGAPQVATVSASGLVRGVGEGGPATITAMSEGKSGTATVTVTSLPQAALDGQWSAVLAAPIVQLHLNLLPDGRVLSWGHYGSPQVWDPATGAFTAVPSPSLMFCAGHNFLPDGRLLVAGGHISDSHGLPNTNVFDAASGSWQPGAAMALGRWYPTNTTLPNGELLTIAGEDQTGTIVSVPEIWDGAAWRRLTTASLSLPNYPRTFVAPDGRIFYAGTQQQSRFLDVTGTGTWTLGPLRKLSARSYGSAVMYEPGKILYVGGGTPATNTAEIIDLNQPSPQWQYTGSMAFNRWQTNATILPTGEVLVTGGTSLSDRSNPAGAVNAAELWNPSDGTWRTLASGAALLRGYHSTSVLLPDGRVLHTGGGDGGGTPNNLNYELYSPPYLFKGARPVISGTLPPVTTHGQTLSLESPDGAGIAEVTLIRLGSATHAFDQGQQLVPLSFSPTSGGLSVTLPTSRTVAPPGPYMLFLVNGAGVPSIGQITRLQ